MSIKQVFADICGSELYKLSHEGTIVGMRAKIYDVPTSAYKYYDFATTLISDKSLQEFLKVNKSKFGVLKLLEFKDTVNHPDGSSTITTTWMTQDEYDNKQIISEFKDSKEAETVLSSLRQVYEYKEG